MTHQTNAQRLADLLELDPSQWGGVAKVAWPAASELRRLAAIEQERDQLRASIKKQFNAVAQWQKANAENPRAFADANLRHEADTAKAEAKSVAEANAILTDENDSLRAQLAALKDGQAGGEVVAYKVNWPGVDSVGMRRFYGADEWETSKATVEFFGGVAIPLTATPKPVPMTDEQIWEIAEFFGVIGPRSRVGKLHNVVIPFARAVLDIGVSK